MEDRYLLGLVAGDQRVIREIYDRFLDASVGWISRNGGDRSDAMDVFQEGLTQILIKAKKDKINLETTFGAYLIGTCKFLWLGKIRKQKRFEKVRSDLKKSHTFEVQEEVFDANEISINTFLERNRTKLSELCQKVLSLIAQNLAPSEIAEQMNMSNANTVYRRKFACMKKWREFIEVDPLFHEWKESQYGN